MQKRWVIKTPQKYTAVEEMRSRLKVDPIVAELLLQRNIHTFEEAERFFRPKLDQLHDPFLMKDMPEAVERLQKAIDNREKVLLFGDYDVDGTTAVALMYTFLKDKIQEVDYYIPDRYTEGYGLSLQGIDFAHENNFNLIIALDCGIKANKEISYARERGIDFIVCDHHTPGDVLPDALVLDPKRSDCTYPFDELSGCGVGFKLLQGLTNKNKWDMDVLFSSLDLLAVSIGADIVPISGENRILSFHGMLKLNNAPRDAFREILTLANRTFPVSLTDVVFTIAPRINAAGRLRSGRFAVELMVSGDLEEIRRLAEEIDADNAERRSLDQQITEEALEQIEQQSNQKKTYTTVVYNKNWHKGVVGIVASRLIESHYKPTIVLTSANGLVTGSARSVKDFDVHEAILKCEHLLENFGGHKYAAGLTMKHENLDLFMDAFENAVANLITKELCIEEQEIDIELSFNQLFTPGENRLKIPRLKRILMQFEPHGPGNMKPVFVSRNVFSTEVRLLKDLHLKLSMTQPNSDVVVEGIGFNLGHKIDEVASGIPFDVAYTLEVNRWRDRETLQLNIKDIRPSV